MAKTPMLLKESTLDCKFLLLDGVERDLMTALKAAHIEKGNKTVTDGQNFDIEVTELDLIDIESLLFVVVIHIGDHIEERKTKVFKLSSDWGISRRVDTSNADLFKDINIDINEATTISASKLTFTVSGIDPALETKFKYFSNVKM